MPDTTNANPNHNDGLAQPNLVARLEASQQVTIVVQQIPLRFIKPNPKNRLITQDMIDAMSESLAMLGLINAIKIRPLGDGTYMVFSGHIRLLGALKLGWVTIACIVSDKTTKETTIEGIWDNRQSTQTWLDDCRDIENLLDDDPDLTIDQLAKLLRTSDSEINRGKRLLKCLNPASRTLIDQNLKKPLISSMPAWQSDKSGSGSSTAKTSKGWELTQAPVYELTNLENPETVFKTLQVVIDQQLTGPQAKALVDHLNAGQPLEAFNPHKPVPSKPKASAPKPQVEGHALSVPISAKKEIGAAPAHSPLPAVLANKVIELPVPHHTAHANTPHQAHPSHAPQLEVSAEETSWFWQWMVGIKFFNQLKSKVKKGETLTRTEKWVVVLYRFYKFIEPPFKFLGKHFGKLLKEAVKGLLHSVKEAIGKTAKSILDFVLPLILIGLLISGILAFFHFAVVSPLQWIEHKIGSIFHHEDTTPPQTTTATTPSSVSAVLPVEAAVPHLVPKKKIEKTTSAVSYQPAVSFVPSDEDPQVLDLEIAAVAKNVVLKNHAVAPDEGMPGDLAVTRMQGVMDPDKYTMMIGSDKRIVLGINVGTTTLTIHHKSADPLNGLSGDGLTNIVLEDVTAIHINEIDTGTKTTTVKYQFSLISEGAKYPLTIQCNSTDDLRHLVSAMEYFIRNSRLSPSGGGLGHDTPLTGMPYPNQGLVLTNACVVEKLWADSPMDKAGVQLGDMVWSTDKNAPLPPERKTLETILAGLTPGSHDLYLVSPEERNKAQILMNQTHSSNFNPKRRKVSLQL